jgi:ribosomal protein S18 acetylase RimI-like enzyme
VRGRLEACQHLVSTDGQRISAVLAYAGDSIEFTWSLAGRALSLHNLITQAQRRTGGIRFLPVLETGRKSWSEMLGLSVLGRYFRAHMPVPQAPPGEMPEGYAFTGFDPERDLEVAARIMNAAYPSLRRLATPEKLKRMTQAPYHDPSGWFFLVEAQGSQPVGLAISSYCSEMREGFIEWIEVIPRLRHRGFGSLLTHECIRRLAVKARFVTTQGSLDAPFVHGGLYRKCGFDRIRQWTILGLPGGADGREDDFIVPPGRPGF